MPELSQQLEHEYFHLTSLVDSFDQKSLTIKAWSVTLTGALAGSGAFLERPALLGLAALASLMFWLVDAHWKSFQYAHFARIDAIEAYFRGEREVLAPFQSAEFWGRARESGGYRELARILFWRHVFLPHGLFAVVLAMLACL